MTTRTLKSEEASLSWREILDSVMAGDQIVVERYNKPTAVIVGYAEWQEIKKLQRLALALQRAQELADKPDLAISWEDVKADMPNA